MTISPPPYADLSRTRAEEFAGLDRGYLDAASITPLPKRTRQAADDFNALRSRPHTMRAEDFTRPVDEARAACARLIGADPSEIALGNNTSFGINVAALGLDVAEGSIALVSDREFPANLYPWMGRSRYAMETVPVTDSGWPDEERILERLRDPRVSILAISSVQFANGYRADLDTLGRTCREENVFLVVDAIQSLGQIPLDVSRTPVDVVAAGGQKWLCGPLGSGFVYVRGEVQDRLAPTVVGWQSMQASQRLESLLDYDARFLPDARRYEQGTPPFQDLSALAASVGLLVDNDIESIRRYLDGLLKPLREWLTGHSRVACLSNLEAGRRSGIVSFRPPSVDATYRSLKAAGVICSVREGGIRIAPHFYNTESDIAVVLDVLEAGERAGWS